MQIVPIFSGGGTRLSAHIGILQALEDMQISFTTIVGISGGSIIASLFSAGKSVDDMLALALETDFKKFKDHSIIRLLRQGGLSSGNKFERWMDEQLGGITFADAKYDLHILATDVNGGGPVVFNRETSPLIKVSRAVRCSMSIPLLFSFQAYRDHLLVDGAILSEDALFQDWQKDGTPSVCFRLRSNPRTLPLKRQKGLLLPQYLSMLIRTFMTALSREYVHAEHWHNTLVINTGEASSVDFSMTIEQKQTLFRQGYETVSQFLPQKLTHISTSQATKPDRNHGTI